MIKRRIFIDKHNIKYKIWYKSLLVSKIRKSFIRNYSIKPDKRLSHIIVNNLTTDKHKFFKSQNKLQCFISYSFKVPSKKVNLSRFYLSKGVNQLYLGGYQK